MGGWGTCFAGRALAVVGADSIVARSSVEAESFGAVVDIQLAVGARPAVDTDAHVSARLVVARGAVQTRPQCRALVHIHRAVATLQHNAPPFNHRRQRRH